MKISNILVPVDFSDCAKNALKHAIYLAKAFNARIHMVNSVHVHHTHPDMAGGATFIDTMVVDYESHVKESFQELESEVIELQDVPHESTQFISYLTDAIYTECRNKHIDIVVMGTHSEHGRLEGFIGTHATDVVESSEVPVLVIPEHVKELKLGKIGFAFDLSQVKNFGRLEILKEFQSVQSGEILVFSVKEDTKDISNENQKAIREVVGRLGAETVGARTIEASSITEGIQGFADAHQLDILAMVPKHRSFFERLFKKSITKRITLESKIPVLTFHE